MIGHGDKMVTTLPLDNDLVWNLLQNENAECRTFEIDIVTSLNNLQDKLLIYISNLGLNVHFDVTHLSYEQKCTLFDQYIQLNRVYSCVQFDHTLLHLVCITRDIKLKSFSIFTDEQAKQYVKDHQQLIDNINIFIDSTLVYFAYQLQLNKYIDQQPLNQLYPVIDDRKFVPQNVVNLFNFDQFIVLYDKADQTRMHYLTAQFENAMFSGEYLCKWFINKHNMLAAFFDEIIQQGQ